MLICCCAKQKCVERKKFIETGTKKNKNVRNAMTQLCSVCVCVF